MRYNKSYVAREKEKSTQYNTNLVIHESRLPQRRGSGPWSCSEVRL